MSRAYCTHCGFPERTCICEHVKPTYNGIKVFVLQHPKEVDNAKNTVALLKLTLTDLEVVVGESQADFEPFRQKLKYYRPALLYPSDDAVQWPEQEVNIDADALILLDGTWKKVFKMVQLNPWLKELPQLRFGPEIRNQYHIRKSPSDNSLSTIEACYYGLECIEGTRHDSLITLFSAFVGQRQSFQLPDSEL